MSEDQLQAFLEAVKADAGLQEKLKAAGDVDAVIAIANTEGFAISALKSCRILKERFLTRSWKLWLGVGARLLYQKH